MAAKKVKMPVVKETEAPKKEMAAGKEAPAKKASVKEEPAKEETAKKASVKEEPAKEELVKKEPAKEETAKEELVKKEPAKEESAKEKPVKKAPAKKKSAKKASVKKAVISGMHIQFAGKSYTQEDFMKMAKDVWRYDLKQKVGALEQVELYVKPEESRVYYVMNGEFTGSFQI